MHPRRLSLLVPLVCVVALSQPLRSQGAAPIAVTIYSQTFTRGTGGPAVERRTFTVPREVKPPYTMTLTNGHPDGTGRVSSANIRLNARLEVNPSSFNQRVAAIQRAVALGAENVVEVELRSAPHSTVAIQVRGLVDADRTTGTVSRSVDEQGAVFELPGVATVTVPPNGVSSATVDVSTVESPYMKLLAKDLHGSIALMALPAVRIKSSKAFRERVELQMEVPGLADMVAEGQQFSFLVLEEQLGAHDESTDALMPIGGFRCGRERVCATLSPSWFLAVNPADPEDPLIQVALALVQPHPEGSLRLWHVDDISPGLPVSQAQAGSIEGIRFRAKFTLYDFFLDTAITSPLSPAFVPLPDSHPAAGDPCVQMIGTNLCVLSGYWRNDNPVKWHGGVDLRTKSEGDYLGLQPVSPLMAGHVGTVERDSWTAGNFVAVQHDPIFATNTVNPPGKLTGGPGLVTQYLHLHADPLPSLGSWVYPHLQMATSDSTGHDEHGNRLPPHLHVDTAFAGQRVDTIPLVSHDMAAFLQPPPALPHLRPTLALAVESSQGMFLREGVVVTGLVTDYSSALTDSDVASLCPAAGDCRLTATLMLYAERLGGHRRLVTWTVDVLRAPIISAFTASPASVPAGGQSLLSVFASDPDGDALAFAWTATCGTLESASGGADNRWTAPASPGTCTVRVTASDPSGAGTTASVNINVETPLPAGASAFYPFDDGVATDESGNGNHGVVIGATPATDRFGRLSAFSFTDTVGGIEVPDIGSNLDVTGDFSFAVWLRQTLPRAGWILNKHVGGINDDGSWQLYLADGRLHFQTTPFSSSAISSPVTRNVWTFAVLTYQRSTGAWRYYLRGVGEAAFAQTSGTAAFTIADTGLPFLIGGRDDYDLNHRFPGALDDVRVFPRTLTPAEVELLYSAGVPTVIDFEGLVVK